ncbi:MAG: hypothetical protein KKB79_01795, partial [Nanoarchaeota archaeon]|nr:hypothetical protein [Nanoarchaeota archaeon]
VAMTIVAVSIVWSVTQNLVDDQTSGAKACFDILGKVSFNDQNTCYTGLETEVQTLQFSIDIGDVYVDAVVIGISEATKNTNLELNLTTSQIDYLTMYDESTDISLPGRNSGSTYIFDMEGAEFTFVPELRITPKINGTFCDTSDVMTNVPQC